MRDFGVLRAIGEPLDGAVDVPRVGFSLAFGWHPPNAPIALCQTPNVGKSLHRRVHVVLPTDVVADVDMLVGKRGRSAFLAEVAREEIHGRQKSIVLRAATGAWKDEDHPELKVGSAGWVRQMRAESENGLDRVE